MKLICYIFLLTMILNSSCVQQGGLSGVIKMDSEENWNSKVYLIQPENFEDIASSYVGVVIDSATIAEDGHFMFDEMPEASEEILLQIAVQKKGEDYPNQLNHENLKTANYFPIVWKNGSDISISADVAHFQNSLSIDDPSPQNAAMLRLRDIRKTALNTYSSKLNEAVHDKNQPLIAEEALLEFRQPLMDFATESKYLLPALMATRWVSVEHNYERVPEFVFAQCQKWQAKQPNHPWVVQLCVKGKREALPVMIGDQIPDFPMPMLSGDTISLVQLLGKRLTILDLWASWCAPCRIENRNYLRPIWEKYGKDELQIIGYALDAGEKAWTTAIEKDGANRWLHASYLQGDDSPLFKALRITTIPANFLIDGKGKIVAKNIHGEELMKFVDDFMK